MQAHRVELRWLDVPLLLFECLTFLEAFILPSFLHFSIVASKCFIADSLLALHYLWNRIRCGEVVEVVVTIGAINGHVYDRIIWIHCSNLPNVFLTGGEVVEVVVTIGAINGHVYDRIIWIHCSNLPNVFLTGPVPNKYASLVRMWKKGLNKLYLIEEFLTNCLSSISITGYFELGKFHSQTTQIPCLMLLLYFC